MTYVYKYIPASLAMNPQPEGEPKNQYLDLFAQTLKEQFYNASNWWTIQEETELGSQLYRSIHVRIAHVINAETGLKLGDDWKTLLFDSIDHPVELGKLYIFDDNTWVTTNTEIRKNLTATCTIRRCNNTLRWIDEPTGAYYEEPCSIEYMVKEPRNYFTQGSPFSTPGGFLHITAQFNERTNLISENQRFLFGNTGHWTAYKVVGTGLNDFRNEVTYSNDSAKVLSLDLVADFINDDSDDIINGIAEANSNLYVVTLNKTSAQGSVGDTIQLIPSITYNGRSVVRDMEWVSSNARYASVNEDGLVTLLADGSCIITGNIENSSASAACSILVTGTPTENIEIKISPDLNYLLEGTSGSYSVYMYKDDVQQSDVFVITCSGSNVPTTSYTFAQLDDNSFEVSNILRSDTSYLLVTCASGSYSKNHTIFLKGAW